MSFEFDLVLIELKLVGLGPAKRHFSTRTNGSLFNSLEKGSFRKYKYGGQSSRKYIMVERVLEKYKYVERVKKNCKYILSEDKHHC